MTWATLGELAELVAARLVGSAETVVSSALPLQDAGPDSITIVDRALHLDRFNASPAVAGVATQVLKDCAKPLLIVPSIHDAFPKIIERLRPIQYQLSTATGRGVSSTASVHPSASVGCGTTILQGCSVAENVTIGSNCVLHANVHVMEGCSLGDGCTLYPNTTLYPGTIVGQRVLMHASVTIGAFGFGYRLQDGQHVRTSQLGWVEIGDDVEIGVGTTVDRGTYGPTRIGTGTKIDNQVQIGHNCHIGRHNLICAQVGIAGSSSTGDYVVLAGQVGVADHIRIQDRVQVAGQSGVMQDLPADAVVLGTPARPNKRALQEISLISRLPDMRQDLRGLQRELEELKQRLAAHSNSRYEAA
ncbi:MAG: UDP-3-O-(3-hydroxymyristoyl)glucosamine N-acyltransferase [Planctomycetales bacterium]|nr:UDP-3-O-(3-hydroxymyristoyl)glucosamine N-acyltransferase [Planctomycetales bacterium]